MVKLSTYVIRAPQVWASQGIRRKRYHMDGAFIAIPPGDQLLRRHYIDIWERCEHYKSLANSRPCLKVEGGFAWDQDRESRDYLFGRRLDADHDQEIRFQFADAPHFEETWAECRQAWKGSMDDPVRFRAYPGDNLVMMAKWGVSAQRITNFAAVMASLGWTIVDPAKGMRRLNFTYFCGPFEERQREPRASAELGPQQVCPLCDPSEPVY
ncbi:Uncharacterized protein PBTT_01183 [Plasmodiophora brassicae]|uniref:Uncharacterized protein n=1 Tax=Plasmodiophora brassicae TaxID=37360 RepID=A0A0G4IYX2_PLABS|nr:hypothetical protein PBRA_001612 [Plasmodiophora brassicae]SPQ93946.1 unnamed protein product [Plasmodiophora brassicae]